jgi:hypothetical protein
VSYGRLLYIENFIEIRIRLEPFKPLERRSKNTSHKQGRGAVRRDVAFAQQAREISISPVLLIWALGN